MGTDHSDKLTNDPQKLLKLKHEDDAQKAQFTNFARSVSGETPVEQGQEFTQQQRETDQQNNMKDVENRTLE